MKKIILILFLFLICIICYLIYNTTKTNKLYILSLGDTISDNNNFNNKEYTYNNMFTNIDYRIIDILNIIKYNQELTINEKNISIHQLLKKTDILIISIGMNDLYYKLNNDEREIYTYMNNMINNYEDLLKEISKYDYKQVFILGYYNITNDKNDLFTYINYKLKKLTNSYNYTYLDTSSILNNNKKYYKNIDNYYLNQEGIKRIYNLIVENLKNY